MFEEKERDCFCDVRYLSMRLMFKLIFRIFYILSQSWCSACMHPPVVMIFILSLVSYVVVQPLSTST